MAKRTLQFTKIRLDGNTQPRVELDEYLISEYQEAYARDEPMPPLQVMHDGVSYWLWDGFHRRWGADRAGLDRLPCIVTEGTQQDAQWASYGANTSHGLRRTNADKAKAVKAALRHPSGVNKSDYQIAEHCGVDQKTVLKYRGELQTTKEIPKSESRTGRDGRTINTANIGKRAAEDDAAVAVCNDVDSDVDESEDERYDSPDYDDLSETPESGLSRSKQRTIADDLREAIDDVRSRWPCTTAAVVASALEGIVMAIRNE